MTEIRTVEPDPVGARNLHVGIVVAGWNRSLTDRLLDGAIKRLEAFQVAKATILRMPGSLELPIGSRRLAETGCDAVVALGVIVKGDTDHYAIVSAESARGLTLVSLEKGIPVANGVLAVHDIADAVDRAQPGSANKGDEAATAAVEAALSLAEVGTTT